MSLAFFSGGPRDARDLALRRRVDLKMYGIGLARRPVAVRRSWYRFHQHDAPDDDRQESHADLDFPVDPS